MTTAALGFDVASDAVVILAIDQDGMRVHLVGTGTEWNSGSTSGFKPISRLSDYGGKAAVVLIHPTLTYSEGMGGGGCDIAPEDRAVIRSVRRQAASVTCVKLAGAEGPRATTEPAGVFSVNLAMLGRAPEIFRSCMTKPNAQDYGWLVTKTFGLNLAVRLFFTVKAVKAGELPLLRAVLSTSWYQIQDSIFTVFGQTYMKFLGQMTGMVRVGRLYLGDFAFVYVQLCGFEFLNRLVLGPLGENPLVYTWGGLGLIFVNIIQGMVSGGPLIPAINKMRRAGVISHPTMMHLYQLTSLTMQFGLFASFGYQKFYAILTGGTLVLSWSLYALFTLGFRDPEFQQVKSGVSPQI